MRGSAFTPGTRNRPWSGSYPPRCAAGGGRRYDRGVNQKNTNKEEWKGEDE